LLVIASIVCRFGAGSVAFASSSFCMAIVRAAIRAARLGCRHGETRLP
jgi:hypothetical protein